MMMSVWLVQMRFTLTWSPRKLPLSSWLVLIPVRQNQLVSFADIGVVFSAATRQDYVRHQLSGRMLLVNLMKVFMMKSHRSVWSVPDIVSSVSLAEKR